MESVSLEENKTKIKAICQNSVVPIRKEAADASEMISQLLFGELCVITEKQGNWVKITADYDQYEGWTDYKHLIELSDNEYDTLRNQVHYISEPHDLLIQDQKPFPITIGAELRNFTEGKLNFFRTEFELQNLPKNLPSNKELLPNLSYQFLNIPYLWGGKSSFGIDCSGFVQTLFKLIQIPLPRDAYQQAEIGEVLSFIEEAEPGDLAFFENSEGKIIHIGMMLHDHKIIHAHGKVRIDTLDYTGIFNAELQKHTHHLRFIRKVL